MNPTKWIYVAPQRIRINDLDFPRLSEWSAYEDLNMQRLARVFAFKGCIGFVGSGASACLGYPGWKGLLPEEMDEGIRSKLLDLLKRELMDPTQAIEITERSLEGGQKQILQSLEKAFFMKENDEERASRLIKAESNHGKSPFTALLALPLSRFVTTNYDTEIENELATRLGPRAWSHEKSFEQDDLDKLIIFAVALASENRQMVFHCHGLLGKEMKREDARNEVSASRNDLRRRIILTDTDYKYWYLSINREVYTLQRCLDITLQSNPLFFVGYSITDFDLLRILRRATLRWESERSASNLFLLLNKDEKVRDVEAGVWSMAKQIKLGVNLLTYERNRTSLSDKLQNINADCNERRKLWKLQPKVKRLDKGPEGGIRPREGFADPLFTPDTLEKDSVIRRIGEAFEVQDPERIKNETGTVVAIIGPAGSGRLLKACQFVEAKKNQYDSLVFHAYNNDDVYSYTKRIYRATLTHLKSRYSNPAQGGSKTSGPTNDPADSMPVLVVINNVDTILGAEPGRDWFPRNRAARQFLTGLLRLEAKLKKDLAPLTGNGPLNIRVLITARELPVPAGSPLAASDPTPDDDHEPEQIKKINNLVTKVKVGAPMKEPFFFGHGSLDLRENEYRLLAWEMQKDYSGMILAAAWINNPGAPTEGRSPAGKMDSLLRSLRSNSSEMGTRVVRHVVRDLDSKERHGGRKYETFLGFLSCFNTPVARKVIDASTECCTNYLKAAATKGDPEPTFDNDPLTELLRLGLVQAVGPYGSTRQSSGEDGLNYIVTPLVKRYFRQVIEHAPTSLEMQGCGLHGLLSRGPFHSPGRSDKPQKLFGHFTRLAAEGVNAYIRRKDPDHREDPPYTAHYIRAMIDILRSNFACNSVPSWGKFRDYIDMLSITIDLLRNYAVAANAYWEPGCELAGNEEEASWFSNQGIASAEEMLHLYNELGLTYYNVGCVQDALSVWELAFDWQRVVALSDRAQGKMYAASLNSHLGMAYLQLGRMRLASGCFEKALRDSQAIGNPDLEARMSGMLGRVQHFRGNVSEARVTYLAVIKKLGIWGNLRAKSYFMRHLASLYARLGKFDKAKKLAGESKAIAASQNAPDLVAFASELEGRVLSAAGETQKAMRAYRVALEEARPLDIARLNADIKLGLANLQLRLGDASSARNRAIEVMELANENLLVLRQAKALLVVGKAAAAFGENRLATSTLLHAKKLAADSDFQLVKHEAEEALVSLRVMAGEQAESGL